MSDSIIIEDYPTSPPPSPQNSLFHCESEFGWDVNHSSGFIVLDVFDGKVHEYMCSWGKCKLNRDKIQHLGTWNHKQWKNAFCTNKGWWVSEPHLCFNFHTEPFNKSQHNAQINFQQSNHQIIPLAHTFTCSCHNSTSHFYTHQVGTNYFTAPMMHNSWKVRQP